jgi:hypothetical protein
MSLLRVIEGDRLTEVTSTTRHICPLQPYRCWEQGAPPVPLHAVQWPNVPHTLPAPLHVEQRRSRHLLQLSLYPIMDPPLRTVWVPR